jgi:Na+/proline symporter
VVEQVLAVAGFTTGLLLGLFLLGSMRRPVRSWAALVGLVVGFLVVLGVWLPSVFDSPLLAWPWFAPVGAGTTVVTALVLNSIGAGRRGMPVA